MRRAKRAVGVVKRGWSWYAASLLLSALGAAATAEDGRHKPSRTVSREYADARALFEKTWTAEKSSHGGDGLGPLFNDSSCVGCHHLGGTGGAGGNDRNVNVLSTFVRPASVGRAGAWFAGELEALHPGLKNHASVVLHRFAVNGDDQRRLTDIKRYCLVQTRDDLIAIGISQRSTPALFGAGLVDSIPDADLLAAENRTFTEFPNVRGRVSRLRGGGLGRFGWKGQTASLREFVLAACANELGLEVPGRHQPTLKSSSAFDPGALKLDMDDAECTLLTRFVANLPRPVYTPVVDSAMTGRIVFDEVGCATCHAPSLGQVDGLYSDLLLHDVGDRIRDSGGGYGSSGGGSRVTDRTDKVAGTAPTGEAGPTEWRTPPLWGVADSGPYLHDGRASTLDEAIRFHGGEAEAISKRYAQLDRADRQCLLAFLHSLRAPKRPGAMSWFTGNGLNARR